MDEMEYQLLIVEQMAKNEVKLSELYAKYGHAFASRKEFWEELAREEISHGAWIGTLKKKVEEGSVAFNRERFNLSLLSEFHDYVQSQEDKIKTGIALIDALKASRKIEETLLEKNFFEVFAGDAPDLEVLLLALEYSTKNHREIVNKACEEEEKMIAA
ncbi:MAG: hypothetical protein WCI36_00320 [bacterium]